MSASAFPFVQVATQALHRLQVSLASKPRLEYLLAQLGWQANIAYTDLAGIQALLNWDNSLTQLITLAEDLRYQRGDVVASAEELITAIAAFYQQISDVIVAPPIIGAAPFNQAGFWPALALDLPPFLLANELKRSSPAVYSLLFITGVIEEKAVLPTATGRLPYTQVLLHWGAIGEFLSNPVGTLSTRYGWGANQVLDYRRVLRELVTLVGLFPVAPRLSTAPAAIATKYYSDGELDNRRIQSLILPFVAGILPDASGAIELGLSLTPIPAAARNGDAPAGFLLAPYLHGGAMQSIPLRSDLVLNFKEGFASDNAVGVEILPGHLNLESDPGTTAIGAEISLIGSPTTPIRFFGTDTTSRLELTGYALSVGVSGTAASPELLIRAGTALAGGPGRLVLYLEPGDGDNFLAQAFGPDPVKLEVGGALTWSSRTGLGIDGTVGLHIRRATNKKVGPLTFHDYTLDVDGQTAAQGHAPLTAALTLGASLKLGPVTATVEKLGVTFELTTLTGTKKGLLDNLGVHWGFKAPTGVGIKVKSDFVNGGGYLYFDAPNHKYAGVANLRIKAGPKEINVNAIGILQTQVPDHPDAYSLLLLLTATFGPIELGLGFKLSGLGGLVGVNRAADTDYLRTLVRTQKLDTLLFPADVMTDPAAAVALADSAFPARVGRHTIGLMAQLGWGVSGSLITLDVALLVEFPEPLTIIMLGVLQASLPSKANELLKLRADFLGYVDFGAKKAAFDATLSESKLLVYSLSGDMAFRLFQGENPVFVITAGGFHPSFQPPAGAALTGLKRITLALAPSNDLRVTLASYYAVTSNTVQFGANLDLYYRLCRGLHVEGHFGFDTLFQFNPFALTAHMVAQVAIKNGNSELLSLSLRLDVTGPRPWHIWGEVSFRIWFVKISVGVNATFNREGGAPEPALTAPDVHAMLVQALAAPTSWEVETPKTAAQPGGVVLRPVAATAGQPFLDPRGALTLRQHVAPFGLLLNKYGSGTSVPVHGRYFTLTELTLGSPTSGRTYKLSDSDSLLEPVREFFAPDQFTALTEAQRLSLPSFQMLPNGLRLKGLASLTSSTQVTRRVVAYEQKLLDGTSGGHRLPVEPEQFRQLAKGGALGQLVAAARPSARAPQPVGWREDSYAVANAADLTAYLGHASFPTQVEAEQYRQAVVAAQPALAAEVLVVPSYELAEA